MVVSYYYCVPVKSGPKTDSRNATTTYQFCLSEDQTGGPKLKPA